MHGDNEYFIWSERINRRYCERHGYTYTLRRDTPRTDRHICWHKVPVILDELSGCDYLLFMDADAVFYSHELTLENEMIPELRNKPILMAQDCGSETLRWHPGYPNSGVILMKHEERVREFFAAWDRITEMDADTRWKWPPTQRALWKHIVPRFKDVLHVVPDYYIIQGRLGQFIRHYCLRSDQYRTHAMQIIDKRLARGER